MVGSALASGPPSPARPTRQPPGRRFTAVQEAADAFSTVWSDAAGAGGPTAVFILDEVGAQVAVSEWNSPDPDRPDRALAQLGWARLTGWELDPNGRSTAEVARLSVHHQSEVPTPGERDPKPEPPGMAPDVTDR